MKVKKLFVVAMFVTISAANLNAQDVQLATLQQGDNLQVFYGADALKNALNVADNGDLITLTAGTFNAANITKAVKIQGAGYVTDAANGKYSTRINGGINIELPDNSVELYIEGIYHNESLRISSNCTFKKCRLNYIYSSGNLKNCIFEQCRITNEVYLSQIIENLYIKNSIINKFSSQNISSSILLENCVITNYVDYNTTAGFKNNIIGGVGYEILWGGAAYNRSLASSCFAYNNIFLRGSHAGDTQLNLDNAQSDENTLFGYAIEYDDNKTYELTPEAATTFLGTGGTKVGIYGGDTPFTSVPTNPQITQKNIATKSTPEGKLNVNITVKAQNQ